MPAAVDFYFDYISPFAYLARPRLEALAKLRSCSIRFHPIVFGAVLEHWGQLGPAEIAPKRDFSFRFIARQAVLLGMDGNGPKTHPFLSLTALRVSLPEVCGAEQPAVVAALFDAVWKEGIDGGSEVELATALETRGFDGKTLVAKTKLPAIKDRLREETQAAITRGVFGVPTTIYEDELFFGFDSLEHLELVLDGKDPLQQARLKALLDRPRGVDRTRVKGMKPA